MNKELSLILLGKLQDAPWLSRTSGVVQVVNRVIDTGDGTFITKRIPVASYATTLDCSSTQADMIPDSSTKGMLYFEDGGVTAPVKARTGWQYTSKLRLVCWLNTQLITGDDTTLLSARVITGIATRLSGNPFSSEPFSRIAVSISNIPVQDATIFSKYDYSETETQYLMSPYEYFALDLSVTYTIAGSCVSEVITLV